MYFNVSYVLSIRKQLTIFFIFTICNYDVIIYLGTKVDSKTSIIPQRNERVIRRAFSTNIVDLEERLNERDNVMCQRRLLKQTCFILNVVPAESLNCSIQEQ